MISIIEELKNGNPHILSCFVEADKIWADSLYDIEEISVNELADNLQIIQSKFESFCGERHLGKMVITHGVRSCSVFFGAIVNQSQRPAKAIQVITEQELMNGLCLCSGHFSVLLSQLHGAS